jgi:DNA modification methylase
MPQALLKWTDEHFQWCREWLTECVRVLKPGGSLFLYNPPKWNVLLGVERCLLV